VTDQNTITDAPLIQNVHWDLNYHVKLGVAWSRFMRGLEKQELWGTRCTACDRVFVPAQSYCEACFEAVENWERLEPSGTLRAVTIVYQGFEGGPEAPYAVGAVEIDGTTSLLIHFIGGVDLADSVTALSAMGDGTRVRAVWAEERSAAITDIKHFEVVSS
jgi:uncharacterized OB-fold protein